MSDFTISGALIMETDQAFAEIKAVRDAADQQVRDWKIQRNTILRQIREGFTLISSLMSSARQAFSVFGGTIDPFFSALIGMVLSTASMLISAATVLVGTGVGAAAGAVIFGLAVGFNILTTIKLIKDKAEINSALFDMQQIIASMTRPRQAPGGLGGI